MSTTEPSAVEVMLETLIGEGYNVMVSKSRDEGDDYDYYTIEVYRARQHVTSASHDTLFDALTEAYTHTPEVVA